MDASEEVEAVELLDAEVVLCSDDDSRLLEDVVLEDDLVEVDSVVREDEELASAAAVRAPWEPVPA